jgi:hypothetical protein
VCVLAGAHTTAWGGCAPVKGDYPFTTSFAYPLTATGSDRISVACCTRSLLDASAYSSCNTATLAGYPLYLGTTTLSIRILT